MATVQPGETVSLRVGATRRARIEISQFTEARVLRASIVVAFPRPGIRSYCWPYFPPTVKLALHY